MTAEPTLAWMLEQYPAARPTGDGVYIILYPLTFGRWRVSRATVVGMLDGY